MILDALLNTPVVILRDCQVASGPEQSVFDVRPCATTRCGIEGIIWKYSGATVRTWYNRSAEPRTTDRRLPPVARESYKKNETKSPLNSDAAKRAVIKYGVRRSRYYGRLEDVRRAVHSTVMNETRFSIIMRTHHFQPSSDLHSDKARSS